MVQELFRALPPNLDLPLQPVETSFNMGRTPQVNVTGITGRQKSRVNVVGIEHETQSIDYHCDYYSYQKLVG